MWGSWSTTTNLLILLYIEGLLVLMNLNFIDLFLHTSLIEQDCCLKINRFYGNLLMLAATSNPIHA